MEVSTWLRGAHGEQRNLAGRSKRHHSRDPAIAALQEKSYQQSAGYELTATISESLVLMNGDNQGGYDEDRRAERDCSASRIGWGLYDR